MNGGTHYLFFDTETGGLDFSHHSLLSMGLVVGQGPNVVDQKEIFIHHEPYVVSAGGLKVNRIDLVSHDEKALMPSLAWEAMLAFLEPHYPAGERIILAGHNIGFDRAFLDGFLKALGQNPEKHFNHRSVDTHSIAAALQDAGKIPASVSLSSSGLFDHFQIAIPSWKRHTALGDALATFSLYWKLVELAGR